MFFWLNAVKLAIERVKNRVSDGGHDIPEHIIRRRYFRGLNNLKLFIPLADFWFVLDNSNRILDCIAEGNKIESNVFNREKWEILK